MDKDKQTTEQTPPDPQVAPTPGQKVQYVITQRSLNGVGGWLLFFVIIFALFSIGEISIFFQALESGVANASETMTVVFAPFLAVAFLASVVLIAMRKKLAVLVTYVGIALLALYSVMSQLVTEGDSNGLAAKAGGIAVALVFYGLLALYFKQSRRVKETLIK